MIDRGSQIRPEGGKPGRQARTDQPRHNEGRVMTAPARLRLLRDAENPWYEMILIEGRNREIRKMFEEVGHHVEKIRRVGYGPLVLDLEPGLSRELTLDEVAALRKAAEGRPTKAAPAVRIPGSGRPARRPGTRPAATEHRKPGRPKSGKPARHRPR
jgi:23S rRNA pseudouridine2605 synthase